MRRKRLVPLIMLSALVTALIGGSCRPETDEITMLQVGEGGQVVARDGITAVSIPPGALSQDTMVWAETVAPEAIPQVENLPIVGGASFGPDGLQFNQPVTVTIALFERFEPGITFHLFRYGEAEGQYENLGPIAVVDADGLSASAQVEHFSTFAVIEDLNGAGLVAVSGYVVDSTGRPIDEAHVEIEVYVGPSPSGVALLEATTTTNANGFFEAIWNPDWTTMLALSGSTSNFQVIAWKDGEPPRLGHASGGIELVFNLQVIIDQIEAAVALFTATIASLSDAYDFAENLATLAPLSPKYYKGHGFAIVEATAAEYYEFESAAQTLETITAQLEGYKNALLANGCDMDTYFSLVIPALETAAAALESQNVGDVEQAISLVQGAIAQVFDNLRHPFSLAPLSGNPGQTLTQSGLPAVHKCPGANLTFTVQTQPSAGQGNVNGGVLSFQIANPKAVGDYSLTVTVEESILGIETSASVNLHVNDVAPTITSTQGASGEPGQNVSVTIAFSDPNLEGAENGWTLAKSGPALQALDNISENVQTNVGGGVIMVNGEIKSPYPDGSYDLQVAVTSPEGLSSPAVTTQLEVVNVGPVIGEPLSAAPQAILPSSESPTQVTVTLRFSDDNGLSDVKKVRFTVDTQNLVEGQAMPTEQEIDGPMTSDEIQFTFSVQGTDGFVTVTASVEDEVETAVATTSIIVENLPPVITSVLCAYSPDTEVLELGVYASDPNGTPITGQVTIAPAPPFGSGPFDLDIVGTVGESTHLSKTWQGVQLSPGRYTATFLVTDGTNSAKAQCTLDVVEHDGRD